MIVILEWIIWNHRPPEMLQEQMRDLIWDLCHFEVSNLEKEIEYWINHENTTNKTIEIIQMFYDE